MGAKFLDLIDRMEANEASIERLFGGEGKRARRKQDDPRYQRELSESIHFLADVLEGRRPLYHLEEALGTDDFPLMFADVLDRQMLGFYREYDPTWSNYARRATVRDFRTVKRFAVDGSEGVLGIVPPQGEYTEAELSETEYSYAVQKYGRRIPFEWEMWLNDDLDAFRRMPERFARAARRTEEKFATELFVDASGPHASFYTGGNSNIVTSNPVLSISALQTAMTVLAAQVDADGEPILIDAVELVVPPALEITAQNILNALTLEVNEAGGTANQTVHTANWMRNRVRLSVNPYIPIVATSNGNTSWFLFVQSGGDERPALEVGFLRGNEEPAIFLKDSNARRIGGGGGDPFDGDFENDAIHYKVRHVLGGTRLDPKMTVASNGSGA